MVAYLPKPLPEYPRYADLANDLRYQKITARMLLSHTAGFANLRQFTADGKLAIYFEPGARYAYSGEGLLLLQFVIETITATPLKELMDARVFGPLGMSRTSMTSLARFEDDYANGYDETGKSLGHQNRRSANAAGSMQTTLRDFSTFMEAVIAGKGLTREAHKAMLSPQVRIHSAHQFPTLSTETTDKNDPIRLSYGLGWGLYWTPYGKAFFKEGHDDGFRNYTVVFEKPKTGIVMLTNSSNGEGIFEEVLQTALRNTFTPVEWENFR